MPQRKIIAAVLVLIASAAHADIEQDRQAAKKLYAAKNYEKACELLARISKATVLWADYYREAQCELQFAAVLLQAKKYDRAKAELTRAINRLNDVRAQGGINGDEARLVRALEETARMALHRVEDVIELLKIGAKTEEALKQAQDSFAKTTARAKELSVTLAQLELALGVAELEKTNLLLDRIRNEELKIACQNRAVSAEKRLEELLLAKAKEERARVATDQQAEATKRLAEIDASIRKSADTIAALDREAATIKEDAERVAREKTKASNDHRENQDAVNALTAKLKEARESSS